MNNKIFLENVRSKESTNTSGGLNVKLKGNRKLLPLNDVSDVISLMEQYTEERDNCNTIRLTCQVNPICSNVLFNRISEIVKYEGSSAVTFLNYGISSEENPFNNPFGNNQVIYKPSGDTAMSFWSGGEMKYQSLDEALSSVPPDTPFSGINRTNIYSNGELTSARNHPTNAIRDTQLSRNDDNGDHFVYHCGLDILNNHLIRSNTFKTVCRMPQDYNTDYTAFNTIADLMRSANGEKVAEKLYFPTTSGVDKGTKLLGLHLYLYDDILPFKESVEKRLIEKYNGWYGFLNKSKIKSYNDFGNLNDPQDLRMERPIMYMQGGDYVDMYPGRDLYSFVPKYNAYRNRMEQNWNYCITYPSSSTTVGFDDIIETSNNSLKAVYFDENTRADSGAMQLVIYSKAMHGLQEGDYVNIYINYEGTDKKEVSELIISNAKVDEVVDPFIFTTYTQGVQISQQWVELDDNDRLAGFTASGVTYTLNIENSKFFSSNIPNDYNRYYIINNRYVNIDRTAQNISFKKTVSDIECDYYVRIFSRLPNFRFASGDTSQEFMIYNKQGEAPSMLEQYQTPDNAFESHVSRLAFARNIYSDEIGEIVFTDDINIANIHDNLGRPLSELYLTIVKNNAGYKEWYGFDGNDANINSENVEFSHCFGKITCGFEMSDESVYDISANNIKVINNVQGTNVGYSSARINTGRTALTPEEIDFSTDVHFYGDLCYYDNYNAIERSIQPILHRFNTAQRESKRASMGNYFSAFIYDEIAKDDYDTGDEFIINTGTISNCNAKKEGYYYIPHYRIPIKSFGKLNSIMPQFLTIQAIINNGESIQVTTQQYHFLTPGDKAVIYDMSTEKYYYLTTIPGDGDNSRIFTCKVSDEDGNFTNRNIDGNNISNYRLFKVDNLGVPSYAHLLKDGTCRYIWRNIINNGSMGSDSNLEEYPFTNGAFYINRRIDLYVRRQDPYDNYGLYDEDDILGVERPIEKINNYRSEDEIKC